MSVSEELTNRLIECAEKQDFESAFDIVRKNQTELAKNLSPIGVRDALKKTTKDRLLLSFLDGAGFESKPLDKALVDLEKLIGFTAGALVLSEAWGLGKVKRVDDFYRRITVDFKVKRGHQFSYPAAVDMLEGAPENHILVFRDSDPDAFANELKEKPGEIVKRILASYGDMSLTRLEDTCVANGFVKAANWKTFWEKARAQLRDGKNPDTGVVEIPVRRSDPLRLRTAKEDYGASWMTAFSHETDPKRILAGVREYVAHDKDALKNATEEDRATIGGRLVFAVKAARKVDDALYARLASTVVSLGFSEPSAQEMRDYLWERKRYVKAAANLPAREVGEMIRLLAVDDVAKARIYAAMGDLCFAAVTEVASQFGGEEACRKAFGEFMRRPIAPPTMTTLIVGKIEQFSEWKELPPLVTLLSQAIALGEGRQSGETLRMQNLVRRLFTDQKWLKKMFDMLNPEDKALFFERFQASIAWDPSSHHAIVVRMTHLAPELESHVVRIEKKKEYARETSYRSFAFRKAEYLKLINEDMPENVRKIEFAKGFGDLSENAEYQYAKDEQRQLMQKQALMQAELEIVKPTDFKSATTDEVMPGVTVLIDTPEGEKTYSILGEWDNDLDKGIISSKTRLAENMLGKKVGDQFEMPNAEGATAFGKIKEIRELSDDIREWIKLPAGMQI